MQSRVLLVAALLLAPCLAPPTRAADLGAGVRVTHAWIRWLPAGVPLGGYATLENVTDHPVTVTRASSPAFGEIALHRTEERAGTMSMQPVSGITLAPHQTLDLAAHGYHMMLMQPKRALVAGDKVPINLYFADGSLVTASFEVRAHE